MSFEAVLCGPGRLKPCIFFASGMGCWKGQKCSFRHGVNLHAKDRSGPRPMKEIRDKIKEEMRRCFDEEDPEVIYQKLQAAADQSKYAYALIVGYLEKLITFEVHQGGHLVFSL
eukprot:Skav214552  [mRNA]  locus=scaffold410:834881:839699:+ [translate_table: standard]